MSTSRIRYPLIQAACLVLAAFAQSARGDDKLTYAVTPIIGYEKAFKSVPSPHSHYRLMYGALVVGGYDILSGEIEATRASDNERFPLDSLETSDQEDRVKLGIRTSREAGAFKGFLRAGGQASRGTHEETRSGAKTVTKGKIGYDPYAGLGVSARVLSQLSLQLGATLVFRDGTGLSRNNVEYSAGIAFTPSGGR